MKVISIDPGVTTGHIIYDTDTKQIIHSGADKFTHDQLFCHLVFHNPDIVLYETFMLYKHKASVQVGSIFYPVQMIGVITLYAQRFMKPIYTQTASVNKSIWTKEYLDYFGYGSKSKHIRDATSQCLTFFKRHRDIDIKESWDKVIKNG